MCFGGGQGVVSKGSIFGSRIQLTYSSVLGAAPLPLLLLAGLATGCFAVPGYQVEVVS